jgi:hypothetical protein
VNRLSSLTVLMLLALLRDGPICEQALILGSACVASLTGHALNDATTLRNASGADGG